MSDRKLVARMMTLLESYWDTATHPSAPAKASFGDATFSTLQLDGRELHFLGAADARAAAKAIKDAGGPKAIVTLSKAFSSAEAFKASEVFAQLAQAGGQHAELMAWIRKNEKKPFTSSALDKEGKNPKGTLYVVAQDPRYAGERWSVFFARDFESNAERAYRMAPDVYATPKPGFGGPEASALLALLKTARRS